MNVLPDTSLIYYCKTNVTAIQPEIVKIGEQFTAGTIVDALKAVQQTIQYIHGTIFNCFYSVTDPVEAAQYNKDFTIVTVIWNLLFNMGYMYTNSKYIINFIFTNLSMTRTWEILGKNIGSFLIRIIYSKYIPRAYF